MSRMLRKSIITLWGLIVPWMAAGQWSSDSAVNSPICRATGEQLMVVDEICGAARAIVSDGSGGAIITWEDQRMNGEQDIYAQRINRDGIIQWDSNGVPISTAEHWQYNPRLATDDSGGAIVAWMDQRGGSVYKVYAQRVDVSGHCRWDMNGVWLDGNSTQQDNVDLVDDGSRGAFFVWDDWDFDVNKTHIYAQHVDSLGTRLWGANGSAVCNEFYTENYPQVVSDGEGGIIVAYQTLLASVQSDFDIYAQRLSRDGTKRWGSAGVPVCTAIGGQSHFSMVSDGDGGVIIAWADMRGGAQHIYAQRIDSVGSIQWDTNGVAVHARPGNQYWPRITSDGVHGAIVTWEDQDASPNIGAQRIDSSGHLRWDTNGVAMSIRHSMQLAPVIISDGSGGAIVSWYVSTGGATGYDVLAQRIDGAGIIRWGQLGIAISQRSGNQIEPVIIDDGSGGAIIAWDDSRNGTDGDIYAQQIDESGMLGNTSAVGVKAERKKPVPLSFVLEQNHPNPFNPTTDIGYSLPVASEVVLKVFDVLGREVATLVNEVKQPGKFILRWDAAGMPSGVYFYRLRAGSFVETKKLIVEK